VSVLGRILVAVAAAEASDARTRRQSGQRHTLTFTPVGARIPNRGSGQDDIFLFGLSYFQRVSDAVRNGALHVEPGVWLLKQ
jgi:hypothetical protein